MSEKSAVAPDAWVHPWSATWHSRRAQFFFVVKGGQGDNWCNWHVMQFPEQLPLPHGIASVEKTLCPVSYALAELRTSGVTITNHKSHRAVHA